MTGKKDVHALDQDLVMAQSKPGCFEFHLSDHWSIHKRPNGGYLMAVMAKAMETRAVKSATPIITANYIHAPSAGEASIKVDVISESNSFSRLMARLFQKGKECVRALGTFSSPAAEPVLESYAQGPPPMAGFNESIQVPVMPDNKLFDHIDLRLDPACTGWVAGSVSDRSEFKGWITFKEKRTIDMPAVLLFADTYPPPVFSQFGPSAWVPTIELSVNIRALPKTRRLQGKFQSRYISAGLVEEDGELWDEEGGLVAISRQVSKYR